MTTMDFSLAFFCQVDDHMQGLAKPPQATLWPSEVVTLGLLHALKGVGKRAFYCWLTKDCGGFAGNMKSAEEPRVTLPRPKGGSTREYKADLHTGGVLPTPAISTNISASPRPPDPERLR